MANLPEKNITTVSAITSIPSNTNIFVNANGQFGQASIDNVVKASNVVNDATLNAMKEFIDNQFQTLTGSPILAQGTEDGYMPSFKGKGGSSQNSYSGYQLFDASKLATKSAGGATVTNNGDGSFTISGSGTSTEKFSQFYDVKGDKFLSLVKDGKMFISGINSNIRPQFSVGVYTSSGTAISILSSDGKSIDVTDYLTEDYMLRFQFYNDANATITAGTIKPMVYQEGDGTWEPYVGAQPSPNPPYPQPIKSKGDMGWFDGELLSGVWLYPTGEYGQNGQYVCGKNIIPCKENDNINIEYAETTSSIGILYYDKDMNYLSYDYIDNGNKLSVTAPTNTCYFRFNVKNDNGITPSTAKKIVVTINGTYAVKIKSVGRNFFGGIEFANALVASGATINATYSTNGIIGLQSSLATGNAIFYDDFKENTQYTIFFKGINSITNKEDVTNMAIVYTDGSSKSISFNTDKSLSLYTSTAGKTIKHIKGSYNTGIAKFEYDYFGIMEGVCTLDDFEPYKEHTEWIPLSEPLRENDTIECVDGVYGVVRGRKKKVYSASEFLSLNVNYTNVTVFALPKPTDSYSYGYYKGEHLISNKFIYGSLTDTNKAVSIMTSASNQFTYWFGFKYGTTLEEAQSIGDIELEYELATPIFEPFADQTPFYRLKTFEGVTHISATDDMEMVVEVPTSRAGGVASIGWSKGNLAQIETQNLSAKIAELQTAIVNM